MRISVADHRRQRVPLLRMRDISAFAGASAHISPETRSRIQYEMHRHAPHARDLLLIAAIIILVAVGSFFLTLALTALIRPLHPPMWVSSIVIPLFPFLFMFPTMWLVIWRSRARAAAAIVRCGHCASCAYPLKTITPQADGCTVCPECGAAWKLPVSTSPEQSEVPAIARA